MQSSFPSVHIGTSPASSRLQSNCRQTHNALIIYKEKNILHLHMYGVLSLELKTLLSSRNVLVTNKWRNANQSKMRTSSVSKTAYWLNPYHKQIEREIILPFQTTADFFVISLIENFPVVTDYVCNITTSSFSEKGSTAIPRSQAFVGSSQWINYLSFEDRVIKRINHWDK